MSVRFDPEVVFQSWYSTLTPLKQHGGLPAKGTVAAALVVLERLRDIPSLDIRDHLARGGAQIAGLTPSALKNILSRHGEKRSFSREGGRTNRGNNAPVEMMLKSLRAHGFDKLSDSDQINGIDSIQGLIVRKIADYFALDKITFSYSSDTPIEKLIHEIVSFAAGRGQDGPVAQHLVGAKLVLRFPDIEISNYSYSAADVQSKRSGDFQVGDTAFHVTVSPGPVLLEKCAENVQNGMNVVVIVPTNKHANANTHASDAQLANAISISVLESFVGQNISEIGGYNKLNMSHSLSELLQVYNNRVSEVESDQSMQIEIPKSLRH